jgi:hypothetical protein
VNFGDGGDRELVSFLSVMAFGRWIHAGDLGSRMTGVGRLDMTSDR